MKPYLQARRLIAPALVLLALTPSLDARAINVSVTTNHADVVPYQAGNTIETGYYDFDQGQVVEDTRLYVRELDVVQSSFFGTTNPGFTTFADYTLPASTDLAFSVPLIAGVDGIARNLLYWDGEGAAEFGAVLPGDNFFLRRSSALNTVLDGSGSPANGFSIETTNPDGEMHNHISFSARGVGGTQPGDGFYLFAMQFAVNGLDDADPVYFLFNADYERDGQNQIVYNGDRPVVNKAAEQLAIDWVLLNLLTTPGDTDGDGDIDDADLGTAFSNYTGPVGALGGKQQVDGDTDNDGDVDDADLGVAFAAYTGPLGPANVPEPGSALLCLVGAGLLCARRRRDRAL